MRKVLIAVSFFFASVVGLGLASQPEGAPVGRQPSQQDSAYSHEVLQRDTNMTQRMSTPGADGPMQRGDVRDAQLEHSQRPGFVGALERHQADIDQMLARPDR